MLSDSTKPTSKLEVSILICCLKKGKFKGIQKTDSKFPVGNCFICSIVPLIAAMLKDTVIGFLCVYALPSFSSGLGSVVGIATGYGLDGPRIESRLGRDFLHLSRPALGPSQPSVQWVLGLSRG